MLRRHYPTSTLLRPRPTPAMAAACRDVEAATLARDGSPPITRTTFPTCRAHYPGGSSGCACRLLPRSHGLPQMAGGSASALSLSRPAQASLTLRPVRLLSRLKRPLSRGSSPSGYPAEPLVSFQINRQLSGWNLPPLMICAFGAHCQEPTSRRWQDPLCRHPVVLRLLHAPACAGHDSGEVAVADAKLALYSGLTATLRNLITPSPCCSVNGPSANRPLCSSAVFWPLSITVICRPLAVIS